ncbi:MAG: UDP-4-amino-4,6-dideoxy-N-acetyl-beta-L-altrosamine transaminase [Rhodobiaceae bacterium]|nr:UDP-4-amino-4,6-dideoxy-N-acetyl-beta-L-altrosamine transaminase [Rhodobiaceae bacterium]
MSFIPYGTQDITDEDIDAVVQILKSNWLTQGPAIGIFEKSVRDYCGARHAVAVNSATSALHIACMALDLGPGDRLWTSPNTFVASANCARYCGAEVDFVDIDALTQNMSTTALEEKLARAKEEGCLPKIVVPVHFAGEPCDMKAIHELGERYGFAIIEDASHAIGGFYDGSPIGGAPYSDITVFSFHPVKIVTSGEGGMAVTNNTELGERLSRLRTHGITRDPVQMAGEAEGPWSYEQIELGYNYRITDIQAALGASQMKRLNEYNAKRHELAGRYDRLLGELPLRLPRRAPENRSGLHLYVVVLEDERRRLSVFNAMRAANIGVNVHYIPVHLQPYYQERGFRAGDFPEAEAYYAGALTLPMYPGLTEGEQDKVVDVLSEALR